MLHNRHKLHMRVAHLLQISRQLLRQLPIRQKAFRVFRRAILAPPAAQVHFVNVQRLFKMAAAPAFGQPIRVPPGVAQLNQLAGRAGAFFRRKSKWIRLVKQPPLLGLQPKLVKVAQLGRSGEKLPKAARQRLHGKALALPTIKITHQPNINRPRGPHHKAPARLAVHFHPMRAQRVIGMKIITLIIQKSLVGGNYSASIHKHTPINLHSNALKIFFGELTGVCPPFSSFIIAYNTQHYNHFFAKLSQNLQCLAHKSLTNYPSMS